MNGSVPNADADGDSGIRQAAERPLARGRFLEHDRVSGVPRAGRVRLRRGHPAVASREGPRRRLRMDTERADRSPTVPGGRPKSSSCRGHGLPAARRRARLAQRGSQRCVARRAEVPGRTVVRGPRPRPAHPHRRASAPYRPIDRRGPRRPEPAARAALPGARLPPSSLRPLLPPALVFAERLREPCSGPATLPEVSRRSGIGLGRPHGPGSLVGPLGCGRGGRPKP